MDMRFGGVVAAILLFTMWLVLAPAHAGGRPSATAAVASVQGDVTCDGVVDATDAAQVLWSSAGLSPSANCLAAAGNVDCAGGIDVADALRILRYFAGLEASPIAGCTPVGEALGALPPTSFDKIEEARAAGTIDDETALLYEIFAVFGDPRLPA
jgi:hypothetical protein